MSDQQIVLAVCTSVIGLGMLALTVVFARELQSTRSNVLASLASARDEVKELGTRTNALANRVAQLEKQAASHVEPASVAKPTTNDAVYQGTLRMPALKAWTREDVVALVKMALHKHVPDKAALEAVANLFSDMDGAAMVDMVQSDDHAFSFADKVCSSCPQPTRARARVRVTLTPYSRRFSWALTASSHPSSSKCLNSSPTRITSVQRRRVPPMRRSNYC